jgi:hypothetical protein
MKVLAWGLPDTDLLAVNMFAGRPHTNKKTNNNCCKKMSTKNPPHSINFAPSHERPDKTRMRSGIHKTP